MEPLLEILKVKRTRRQQVKLLRQRLYLWRKFRNAKLTTYRGVVTKRALAKALRMRLAEMSKTEAYKYWKDPSERGVHYKEKLVKHNKRERLMILSILTDMYSLFTGPDHLGVE